MKNKFSTVLLICVFAFVVRFGYILTMNNSQLALYEDDGTYHTIAKNVLDGKGYYTLNPHLNGQEIWYSFRAPVFVMFLVFVYSLFGWENYLAAKLFLTLFAVILCISGYFLGKKLFNPFVGLVVAIIIAIFPSFVFYSTHIQGEIIFVTLLTAAILCIYLDYEKDNKLAVLAAGILFGLCSLTRSMIAPFIVAVLYWLWLTKKGNKSYMTMVIFLVGFVICLSPWWYRNYRIYHRVVPFTTEGGFTLWVGNNPLASGGGECNIPPLTVEESKLSDYQLDKLFYRKSFDYIRANPGQFMRLAASKFVRLWRPYPLVGGKFIKLINLLTYVPLYIFAGIGIFVYRKQWRKLLLIYLLFLYYTVVHSIFPSMTRYRLPLEPYLIIFAVVGMMKIIEQKFKRNLTDADR